MTDHSVRRRISILIVTRIRVPYHLDEHLPELNTPVATAQTVTAELPDGDTWHRVACLYESVADTVAHIVRNGRRPVVVSGDCTTALATVAGLQRSGLRPAIVWFDAHGDLHTPESTTSGYAGGMPLRLLVGARPELIAHRLGLRAVPEERVVLADGRDLDPPERDYLGRSAIRHVPVSAVTADGLPDAPIYLHVDLDVIDADHLPGLRYPAPAGPDPRSVADAIRRVMDTGHVAALGLGCTWHPGADAAERLRPVLEPLVETLS